MNAKELKAKLTAEGFLVFRTLSSEVRLAERIRENLILDSGVAALIGEETFGVRLSVRSEASSLPGAAEEQHFARARERALPVTAGGYQEAERFALPVLDPGDAARTLDTWYELAFQKLGLTLPELLAELHWALDQSRHG